MGGASGAVFGCPFFLLLLLHFFGLNAVDVYDCMIVRVFMSYPFELNTHNILCVCVYSCLYGHVLLCIGSTNLPSLLFLRLPCRRHPPPSSSTGGAGGSTVCTRRIRRASRSSSAPTSPGKESASTAPFLVCVSLPFEDVCDKHFGSLFICLSFAIASCDFTYYSLHF